MSVKDLSLWWDELGEPAARPALEGDMDVDVAIVGGGFTGLWTARSLLERDPQLRVLILEQELCGFGASGRNGGWASALFAASQARLAREHGLEQALAMGRAMRSSIDELERATRHDGIECHFHRGGTISAARSPAQVARCKTELEEARALGVAEEDLRWLNAEEASSLLAAEGLLGATFTPHCATIQPAALAVGLADAVEARGATILEHTPVRSIEAGSATVRPLLRSPLGTVRAEVVVRATEGWSSQLQGSRRAVIPVYSLMIATERLSESQWSSIGLSNRETFNDHRHLVIYGQRSHDGRIAFGGRGAPYHFGSAIKPSFERNTKVFEQLHATLVELFPALSEVAITHRWGGPLGVPRDWCSSVGFDASTGLAWAGGYVGDGVSTSNLAGRTLADLITGQQSELTALPWVNHRSPSWEPEPLRWLGVNAGIIATRLADASEAHSDKPSRMAKAMGRLLGD
jgi:glycine/D-amino acid oxidase-like deaminating enzyme